MDLPRLPAALVFAKNVLRNEKALQNDANLPQDPEPVIPLPKVTVSRVESVGSSPRANRPNASQPHHPHHPRLAHSPSADRRAGRAFICRDAGSARELGARTPAMRAVRRARTESPSFSSSSSSAVRPLLEKRAPLAITAGRSPDPSRARTLRCPAAAAAAERQREK
ncbi:unnamed protein product [Lampetra planeri]